MAHQLVMASKKLFVRVWKRTQFALFKPLFTGRLEHFTLFLLISLLAFKAGFVVGQLNPLPQYQIDKQSIFEQHRADILYAYTEAVVTLRNCKPFERQYPTQFKKFLRLIAHGQGIGYDADLAEEYIAYANLVTSTIWLGPEYFKQEAKEQERTIAHEIFHLVGFPGHKDLNSFKNDPIYKISDECYWLLPKEAI